MHFSFLSHYILAFKALSYLVVFFGMFFEGDVFLFVTAFLTHARLFEPLPIFITVFSGVIIGDIAWYFFGTWSYKFPTISKWLEKITGRGDKLLQNRTLQTLFVSKFIYGFHHLLLMRAGNLKLGIRRFIKSDLLASLVWIFIISSLGYGAGASFELVKSELKFAEIFLLILVIVFLMAEHFLGNRLKRKI